MKFPENKIINLLDQDAKYNLAESTPLDIELHQIYDSDFVHDIKSLDLRYESSLGSLELRKMLAAKLGVRPDELITVAGSTFGIFLLLITICDKDDEVLTIEPNFPPTVNLITAFGFKKNIVRLNFDSRYELREEDVYSSMSPKVKLVILTTPMSPSGIKLSQKLIGKVAQHIAKHYPDCLVVIDETYREATYERCKPIPTASGLLDNLITVSSFSKSHGAPGLRIGWIHSIDRGLLKKLARSKMNTMISNSRVDEIIGIHLLKKESMILGNSSQRLKKGLDLTKSWVEVNSGYLEWIEPDAGAMCCLRLRKDVFDEKKIEKFYKELEWNRIMVANGQWFGDEYRCFRFGFGYLKEGELEKVLKKLNLIIEKVTKVESKKTLL